MAKYIKKEKPQPVPGKICRHFGCGKTLLDFELLNGDYCTKHARQQNATRNRLANAHNLNFDL